MPIVNAGASALALTLKSEAGGVHVEQRAIVTAACGRLHPAAASLDKVGADGAVVRLLLLLISRSSCEVRRFWWDSLVTRERDELCGHNRSNEVGDKLLPL